jgi:hypothetical protein
VPSEVIWGSNELEDFQCQWGFTVSHSDETGQDTRSYLSHKMSKYKLLLCWRVARHKVWQVISWTYINGSKASVLKWVQYSQRKFLADISADRPMGLKVPGVQELMYKLKGLIWVCLIGFWITAFLHTCKAVKEISFKKLRIQIGLETPCRYIQSKITVIFGQQLNFSHYNFVSLRIMAHYGPEDTHCNVHLDPFFHG